MHNCWGVYKKLSCAIGGRWGALTHYFSFNLSLVEVPVAPTCSTSESSSCPFSTTCHELSATINSIPSNICCMILLALSILHTPNTSLRLLSSHNHLALPHLLDFTSSTTAVHPSDPSSLPLLPVSKLKPCKVMPWNSLRALVNWNQKLNRKK